MARLGLPWLRLSLLVLLLDQASKRLVEGTIEPYRPVAVIPSFNLYLTYNTGISFSFLQLPGSVQRWPLAIFTIVVLVLLIRWMRTLPKDKSLLLAGLAMVIGGAAGNLVDRVLSGQITDFVQLYAGTWSFAIFNLADAALNIGVGLILLDAVLYRRKPVVET
jgi:signal peptidase II